MIDAGARKQGEGGRLSGAGNVRGQALRLAPCFPPLLVLLRITRLELLHGE